MPTIALNGRSAPDVSGGWGSNRPLWSYANLPTGRAAANGQRPIIINSLYLYVGGNGAARTVQFFTSNEFGNNVISGNLTAGAGPAIYRSARINSGFYHATGQLFRYGITGPTGALYIGRASVPGRNIEGTSFTNMALAGAVTYGEVPPAPRMLSVTPGPAGRVTVRFQSRGTGDSAITGWRLQYATNAAFTQNVVTVNSSGTTSLTLTPGTTYWFRAAGRNAVSDMIGATGPWSSAMSAQMMSGGRLRVNGAWRNVRVRLRVNEAWRDVRIRQRVAGAWRDAR